MGPVFPAPFEQLAACTEIVVAEIARGSNISSKFLLVSFEYVDWHSEGGPNTNSGSSWPDLAGAVVPLVIGGVF